MAEMGRRGYREGNTNSFMRRESQDGGRQVRQVGDNTDLPPGAVLLPFPLLLPIPPLLVSLLLLLLPLSSSTFGG